MFQTVERHVARIRSLETGGTRPGMHVVGYVRSAGSYAEDGDEITPLYTSLTSAFAACVAGRDNVIYVLPGHSEAVGTTLMANCIAGTTVIGIGESDQSNAPTLLWSVASSNLAIATANFTIANMRLMADADGVTQAITVTAAGFKMVDCYVDAGVSSAKDILIFLGISTGADNVLIACNTMRATTGGNTSLIITQTAATDNLKVLGNWIFGASQSTTIGQVIFATATTNLLVAGNIVDQQIAAGTAAINIADVAMTGCLANNYTGCLSAAGQTGLMGILMAAETNQLTHYFNNYNSDGDKGSSGILNPVVTA